MPTHSNMTSFSSTDVHLLIADVTIPCPSVAPRSPGAVLEEAEPAAAPAQEGAEVVDLEMDSAE